MRQNSKKKKKKNKGKRRCDSLLFKPSRLRKALWQCRNLFKFHPLLFLLLFLSHIPYFVYTLIYFFFYTVWKVIRVVYESKKKKKRNSALELGRGLRLEADVLSELLFRFLSLFFLSLSLSLSFFAHKCGTKCIYSVDS